jgi:arginase family enzyme
MVRQPGPTYHVLGVPLRTGSLYPGSENDAQPYREARLLDRLQAAGCAAVDDGDVPIPTYLPHHAVPPIRNWPGPRIAWDCVGARLSPLLAQPGHVALLVGCDCSIVVGTAQAVARQASAETHVIYLDGDFDDAAPTADRCRSAAAVAVWLLTQPSWFWTGPPLPPARVSVVGWTQPPAASATAVRARSLGDVRRAGPRATAAEVLEGIPDSASILLHLDIDVFQRRALPAAYFPHDEGLTLAEGAELFRALARDPRVRVIEVSEYASLRDADQRSVAALVDLLAGGLAP